MTGTNARSNGGKAVFADAYTQPDPRAYYRELGALDYEVPQHGQRVFDVGWRHSTSCSPPSSISVAPTA